MQEANSGLLEATCAGVAARPSTSLAMPALELSALQDRACGMPAFSAADDLAGYRLLVADSRVTRERVWRLAHRAYCQRGHFSPDQDGGVYTLPHDTDSETLTLLVEDQTGADVATVTLVFDSPRGLPCECIYKSELNVLRSENRRIVEVARLAFCTRQSLPKMLLVRLFNIIYIYARLIKGYTDFVVEVVPHHSGFYKRLLKFEPCGPNRKWALGQNSVVTLLRLDLELARQEIERFRFEPCNSNLYAESMTRAGEEAVIEFFSKAHCP